MPHYNFLPPEPHAPNFYDRLSKPSFFEVRFGQSLTLLFTAPV